MANGHQKAEHSGNFFQTPRRVLESVAWRYLGLRARAILQLFQAAHNGFNNGEIALGIHEIGQRLGDQNHRGNSRAVAELIEKGFLECTSKADHANAKTRTYRITFIASGPARAVEKATHEYADWRPSPLQKRKFGGARTATQNLVSIAVTPTMIKNSVAATASEDTESRGFEGHECVAVTAPLIDNHSRDAGISENISSLTLRKLGGPDLRAEVETLRDWVAEVIERAGYGGARALAKEAGVSESALSRFRSGRNLPDRFRAPLQEACARQIPFNARQAA